MSNDDTFFGSGGGSDKTILKPRPGGRGSAPRQSPPSRPPAPPSAPQGAAATPAISVSGLCGAAAPLISLAGRLAGTASHSDPAALSGQVVAEVQRFEQATQAAGIQPERVMTARYILCSLIDETVLNTPWGSQSSWAGQTLLSIFHKEAWGGEKCFEILDRLMQQPGQNIDLIELMFHCLSMGFEGKYRNSPDRSAVLTQLRQRLAETIRRHKGEANRELSPQWRGVQQTESPITRSIPIWAFASIAAGVVLLVYLAFLFSLNRLSDPVVLQVANLGREVPPIVERRAFVQERELKLSDLLQTEVQQGLVEIREIEDTEVMTLRALFPSGSADMNSKGRDLLTAIGKALGQLPGPILITGHTDNVPSRSIRFPSNWHLSRSRAESVAAFLGDYVAPERLVAEPRADSEPLVANDSATNKAINRRVEITLFAELGR